MCAPPYGLARYFDTDALSWLNLQTAFELRTAEITSGKSIAKQVRKRAAYTSLQKECS